MYKKGSSVVTIPIITVFCIFFILVVGTLIINSIIPFIYHQKLNVISAKYMFVIEKFGYLTTSEKQLLIKELNDSGFDTNNLELKYPSVKKSYGELIEFELKYTYKYKIPSYDGGKVVIKEKVTILTVRKNSYSKI